LDIPGLYLGVVVTEGQADEPCKLWFTKLVRQRLSVIQGGNARRLVVRHSLAIGTVARAKAAERVARGLLADRKIGGGWYRVGVRHAVAALIEACQEGATA